jgi:hypothetical protein
MRKMQKEFKASNYIVLTTKKLVTEKGILLSSTVILDKVLPPATVEMVKQFLISDKISRIQPGTKKNCFS